MRIMVFDVPAESGGALTILNQYYDKAVNETKSKWIFVVSTPKLSETKNVKVLSFPWIKKSWIHRLYFDMFIAHKLVDKYKVDEVLSLQNVIVRNVNTKQSLYLHQPLPFVDKRYRITENFLFWVYQNLIGRMIFNSIRKADKVIVQTNWMKEACIKKVNVNPKKITVIPPEINIKVKSHFVRTKESMSTFFYPASGLVYKNHSLIVDAAMLLKQSGIIGYKIVFTLKGNENNHINRLYNISKKNDLPIEFVGSLSQNQVYKYYTHSILLFPSYIETFGLPLQEAKMHNSPILASDINFSHEILHEYEKCSFFRFDDFYALSQLMKEHICNQIKE